MSTPNIRPTQTANQRRSQRILLSVPLRVSGKRANGTPFVEHTKTLIVSAHGALLQLKEPVQDGQALSIFGKFRRRQIWGKGQGGWRLEQALRCWLCWSL